MNLKTHEELLISDKQLLASRLPSALQNPRVGIVCGSGLSTLASNLRNIVEIPYSDLEGFGKSTGKSFSVL